MGLDGFSMGNLGLNADMTSAQMANQAEQLAKKESQFKIKDVESSDEGQGIKRKEEQDEDKNEFQDGFKNKEESEKQEDKFKSGGLTEKDLEDQDLKEFSVRVNQQTELVELFNNKNDKVFETISATELVQLVSKLDGVSGVLVNRKI